jgi:hypothetical protein
MTVRFTESVEAFRKLSRISSPQLVDATTSFTTTS